MARVQRVIDDGISFYEHAIERDEGVTLFRGRARFASEREIECAGQVVEFEHAVIATGARPTIPAILGLDQVPFATSDDLLRATELPPHLVALGAGAISLEFAQAYRRLGAEVTVVLRGDHVARGEDAELTALLATYLEREGVRIQAGIAPERVELDGGRPSVVLVDGTRVTGDRLLVGLGRTPDVDGLGLEEAGIAFGPGGVTVDEHLRTTQPHVFAIGDSIGGMMFTHVATYEAPIAVANMLDGTAERPDYRTIPRVIFTDPELAGVGLSETEAREAGYEVEVRRFAVGKGGKARALGDRRGRVKFILDAKTGVILGAHILSRHGADLLPGPMIAMNAIGGTLAPLLATIHPHPTLSEAVKVAARDG